MLRALVGSAMLLSASMASAQIVPSVGAPGGVMITQPGNSVLNGTGGNGALLPDTVSNRMREGSRLKESIALREKAFALKDADGGELSASHRRYINKRAVEILSK